MESDLKNLSTWFCANKLSLNLDKTNYVLFRPKTLINNDQNLYILRVEDNIIKAESEVTFLGLKLHENLDWTSYFKSLSSKLSKSIYILNSVKNFIPQFIRKLLYNSMFLSHINYGLLLWGPNISTAQVNILTKLQKKAIRITKNTGYTAHTNDLFKELKLPKIDDIIKLEILKFVHKFMYIKLPKPLMKICKANNIVHQHNTRNRNAPRQPISRTSIHKNSFISKGPGLWLHMDKKLRPIVNLKRFCCTFKDIAIDSY